MPVTATFIVQAKDHNGDLVVAQGFSDGTIMIRDAFGITIELPAELVRQIRDAR